MKHLKTQKQLNESSKNLNISDVGSNKTYKYNELVEYIKDAIHHFTFNTEIEPEDSDVENWIIDNIKI